MNNPILENALNQSDSHEHLPTKLWDLFG